MFKVLVVQLQLRYRKRVQRHLHSARRRRIWIHLWKRSGA